MQDKDIPKLVKSGINLEALFRNLNKLKTNPYTTSRSKVGDLSGYRGMDFKKGYRLVFKIDEEKKEVLVLSIDSHDEAYKKAKKRK